jgi:hypothetical protein
VKRFLELKVHENKNLMALYCISIWLAGPYL